MRLLTPCFLCILAAPAAFAQWNLEQSSTTASLRGIYNAGNGTAWASGTEGTVLRTMDEGKTWERCATPPGGGKLDFRGIQAWDGNTAVVMSSGPGDQSRLYKTSDGCRTWKLVFTNPDAPNGFFDAVQFVSESAHGSGRNGLVIGDPVEGRFAMFETHDDGEHWTRIDSIAAQDGEAIFAASNSSLLRALDSTLFVTGGPVSHSYNSSDSAIVDLPLQRGVSAGAFSVAARLRPGQTSAAHRVLVAVGGDYHQPDRSVGTCATSENDGSHWSACRTPPRGYRSAVAYDARSQAWIAVGPNGTDISSDDGRNWRPLKRPNRGAADADKNWNALSLPYVVGPKGRIGKYIR